MKLVLIRYAAVVAAAVTTVLAGCGGGGGTTAPAQQPVSVQQVLVQAGAEASNDTSGNPVAAFAVLQAAGVPVVTINSAPKVNFAVFSDGAVKKDVAISGVSAIIAKLVPGTNGEPDRWVSYTYRKERGDLGFHARSESTRE